MLEKMLSNDDVIVVCDYSSSMFYGHLYVKLKFPEPYFKRQLLQK
jgi:hypothetical protein